MHVLIIGGGAIGCLLAARLAERGHATTLLARPATAAAIRTRGLLLQEADGRRLAPPVIAVETAEQALSTAFDLAVAAVKAYDTAALAAELRPLLPASTPLLSVQNGVGNEALLAAALPGPIMAGALTTPVEVLAPGHVRVARPSHKLALAPWRGASDLSRFSELFTEAGFTTQLFRDGPALKWSKLLMNLPANAQPAILGTTPAEVFAHPALADLEVRAWQEALAVLRRAHITPVALGGYPLALFAALAARLPRRLVRPFMARFMVGARGSKPPSLTYDLERGRGRSEVEWLNGAVATEAARLGLAAPINQTFTRLLLDLVTRRADPAAWRDQPQRLLNAVQKTAG